DNLSNLRNLWTTPLRSLRIEFAEQPEPRGTADALLRAEPFASGDSVVVVNADNLYPRSALEALRALPRAGLIGFRRSALVRTSNFPAERVRDYALLEVDPQGDLVRIVEKPSPDAAAGFGRDPLVSMNVWLMPPSIYGAARAVPPSPRSELELQDAVRGAIAAGEQFRVIESTEGVLDLSHPEDILTVEARLQDVEIRL
ncbi:MAG: sugar phosphate nucleotidyltransferase, partial [Gemmatimonadales bacterium]